MRRWPRRFSGEHPHRKHAEGLACLDIEDPIAHHNGATRCTPQARQRRLQMSRMRFDLGHLIARQKRLTVLLHLGKHAPHGRGTVARHNAHPNATLAQCLQKLWHTGEEAAALGRFDLDVLDELVRLLEKVLGAVGVLLL